MNREDDAIDGEDPLAPLSPTRRSLLALALVAPAAAACAGCVPRRLACAPQAGETSPPHCQHRFCRYYDGP